MEYYKRGDIIEVKNKVYSVLVVLDINPYIKHLICFDGQDVVLIVMREATKPWVAYNKLRYIVTTGADICCEATIIDVTHDVDLQDMTNKIKNFNR